jgi:hydrogenase large subunit
LAAAKNVGNTFGYNVHYEDGGPGWDTPASDVPEAGALVRDMAYGSNFVASHLVHFYQLAALDFIDPLAAGLDKPPFCPSYASDLTSGTWPYDYYYRVPTNLGGKNLNVYLVAQYVLSLEFRRKCNQIGAIWSGRAPFIQGLLPGGISSSISQAAIDKTRELLYKGSGSGTPSAPAAGTILKFIGQPTDFAKWVKDEGADPTILPIIGNGTSLYAGTMMFDVFAVAMFYPEYFWLGNAYERFLAYGVFEHGDESNPIGDKRLLSRGRKNTGDIYTGQTPGTLTAPSSPPEWNPALQSNVYENVKNSYYTDTTDNKWRHPWKGKTSPNPGKSGAYSWVKSPRYKVGSNYLPYEVGPLARMMVNGSYYAGVLADVYESVVGNRLIPVPPFNAVSAEIPQYGDAAPDLGAVFGHNLPDLSAAPFSLTYTGDGALDRYAARQLEAWKVATAMVDWLDRLEGSHIGKVTALTTKPVPDKAKGYGWTEAPRGALGHWMKVQNGKILKYQCVVPSTWNASPTDVLGQKGPAEKAMLNTYVYDDTRPLEVLRVSHSWDFCTACAVHLVKRNGKGEKEEETVIEIKPTHPGM